MTDRGDLAPGAVWRERETGDLFKVTGGSWTPYGWQVSLTRCEAEGRETYKHLMDRVDKDFEHVSYGDRFAEPDGSSRGGFDSPGVELRCDGLHDRCADSCPCAAYPQPPWGRVADAGERVDLPVLQRLVGWGHHSITFGMELVESALRRVRELRGSRDSSSPMGAGGKRWQ